MDNGLSPYEAWQQERYGDIIPELGIGNAGEIFENGSEESNRFYEWMQLQDELQLEMEDHY